MPINKIGPSSRGRAAIAAAIVFASVSGWTAFVGSRTTPAHPEVTPAIIHAAVAKGLTPPAVDLAIEKLIKPWEGLVLKAHWDQFSKRYDICYGDTLIDGKPVQPGMTKTPDECLAILKVRVTRDYFLPLVDGVKGYAQAPVGTQASMLAGAYNFGVPAMEQSRAAGFIGRNLYKDGCIAQTAFNKAGGHTLPGLVARREMGDKQRDGEAEICVSGL